MTDKDIMESKVGISAVLKSAVNVGLIGGVVAVSMAVEGLFQAFVTRDIVSGVLSMSQMLLLVALFFMAHIAVSRSGTKQPRLILLSGAVSGFVSSLLLVALIALGSVVKLGDMFINATPSLYDILTFKQGLIVGSFSLVVLATVIGILAGVINLLPTLVRRPIVYALVTVVVVGLLQDLITTTLQDFGGLIGLTKFFFTSNGVSLPGTVTLLILVGVGSYVWARRGAQVRQRFDALPPNTRRTLRWSSISIGILIMLTLPMFLGLYLSQVFDTIGLYLLMGLGLNIVVGFAGLLDLGYVAFFAIGAYTVAILTSPEHATGVIGNWWLALPFGVAAALLAGVILGIPVLRMRGDYLAIVTLGFGEIVRLLAISDFLKPWEGGAQGIQRIPNPDIGPFTFGPSQLTLPLLGTIQWGVSQQFYYLFLAACILVMFIAIRVKSSRIGRAWMAVREDEDVAQAMGINLVATKLMAFGLGASFGGLAGAIASSQLQSVYPQNLTFLISVYVLSVIIIGGMGSIPGVIVGALAVAGLPELLREVGDYRYLFFGAALVVVMLTRPEGLLPEARRRLELEEFREEGVKEESATSPA
jgi:branched-chain amino acid transport system permease protein